MYMYNMYFYLYPLYFIINLLCKSYQGTQKIVQKKQKREGKKKQKKNILKTPHTVHI